MDDPIVLTMDVHAYRHWLMLLHAQCGIIDRSQALGAGLSDRQNKRRDNLNLAREGVQTFRFGPVEVTELACESAVMVAAALRRNGWKGTPGPCRRPGCPLGKG